VSGQGKRIGCVIVAHGNVGECLMDAVQGILGTQANWAAVSNSGMGLGDLSEAVASAVAGLASECEVVVISDMPGGSCHHVCQEIVAGGNGIRALTGVNLMMLLEFFVRRDRIEVEELIHLVKERGRDAVRIL
jgi:mannose/fructose-specific phosphotransferase system component IIA